MGLVGVVGIYFVLWWIVVFAILPFGMATQDEAGEVTLGTPRSAPVRPRLVRVAVITTIVDAIIVAAIWVAVDRYGITFDVIANWYSLRS